MAIPYLPPEILANIFLRLDLKTLSSARLVKKCWLQFISSPYFARVYLKNSEKDESLSDHRVIFPTSFFTSTLRQFSIASLSWCSSSSINLVNFDHPKRLIDIRFKGSCNGLVWLIIETRNVILWNPFTGKYKELCSLDIDDRRICQSFTYGFGYDESNDDYKVVVLCRFYDGVDKSSRYVVKVNSLKKNYWKTIDQDFKSRGVSGLGKVASGKVHWLADRVIEGYWRKGIISFDLGSEVFGIVEQPSYGDGYFEMTLDALEGCICLLISNRRTRADLWIMKEYGVKESWTKVVTISCIDVLGEFSCLSLWSMLPSGEILFSTSESFAVYNPKDDSFKFIGIVKNSRSEPVTYVPSLLSPVDYWKAGDEESKAGAISVIEYLRQDCLNLIVTSKCPNTHSLLP